MMRTRILGTGRGIPDTVLTNADLEKMVDTNDEWIVTRSGIRERHIAQVGEGNSVYCVKAATSALKNAGITAEQIDLIIVATVTPDFKFPATAVLVQAKIGAKNAAAFDVAAACSGFLYGLDMADAYLRTGKAKYVLVIGSEILTSMVDWEDRATAVLFGDGSGAVILTAEDTDNDSGLLSTYIKSDGTLAHLLYCPGSGSINPPTYKTVDAKMHFIKMQGNEVFKHAVRMMEESAVIALERAGISFDQVDLLIPHQANIRIIEATQKRMKLPNEKVYINLDRYGNTSSASIPIAFDEAIELGLVKRGSIVVFVAFGGGFTWGSAVVRY